MTEKRSRVKEIYEYCRDNDLPMLSSYNADFWELYVANYNYFDKLFCNSYKNFMAFANDEGNVAENTVDWIFDVAAWLKANDKRYSELWRLQGLADIDYSILDPYHITESHSSSNSSSGTDNIGGRTDTKSASLVYGAKSETDTNSYTHGAKSETDGSTLNYGQDITETESEVNTGAQQNTTENTVSADNVSAYSPKDYVDNNLGSRQDTTESTETRHSRQDTTSGTHTEAQYIDSESKSHGENAHTDTVSDTNIYGAHTNTHQGSETGSKSVTKHGNLGVYSNAKLLSEHTELWTAFNFYKMIFDEIAEEFLRIVYF